jgi:oxygen-independent coproporphyrinogen III oxidase
MALNPAPVGGWPIPLAAYVHVPFCRHRCGYCNFSVIADRDDLIERFLAAIDQELSALNRPALNTLFIGGGTPTHLGLTALSRLLSSLHERFDLQTGYEWTVEANPEDITAEKLELLAQHGVNRVSLGVQSFHDVKLKTLERGHTGDSARQTIERVASVIPNVSIDLIFGSPGETTDAWSHDLESALATPLQHLSTYCLTVEKGTAFWNRKQRGELTSADEDSEVGMYVTTQQQASAAGLAQYEVSNFARPGFQCRHNSAYWDGQGWFAAGPGAARFIHGRREVNHRSPLTYLKRMEAGGNATAESEAITLHQYARERAAFGIRMLQGINIDQISRSAGVDLREICADAIQRSIAEDLLEETEQRLALTPRGILFADTVASRFLSS